MLSHQNNILNRYSLYSTSLCNLCLALFYYVNREIDFDWMSHPLLYLIRPSFVLILMKTFFYWKSSNMWIFCRLTCLHHLNEFFLLLYFCFVLEFELDFFNIIFHLQLCLVVKSNYLKFIWFIYEVIGVCYCRNIIVLRFQSFADFVIILLFLYFQDVLSEESMSLKFLDVATILLKYCGPKSLEKGETQAVIVDLIATLGFFCANRRENQVWCFALLLLLSFQSEMIN